MLLSTPVGVACNVNTGLAAEPVCTAAKPLAVENATDVRPEADTADPLGATSIKSPVFKKSTIVIVGKGDVAKLNEKFVPGSSNAPLRNRANWLTLVYDVRREDVNVWPVPVVAAEK